jgi:hypothetical protein
MNAEYLFSLASRFHKLATSKSYQEGFQDGTEDIKLDQWGSPREAYIARQQYHEQYESTKGYWDAEGKWMKDKSIPFDIDYAGYRQGYMAAAFTSEKKHEINKDFWDVPSEHAWKHKPHSEKDETSFEGVLDARDTEQDWHSDPNSTYSGSAKGLRISKHRAFKELQKHHQTSPDDFAQFLADLGDHETYDAQEVLHWLGY